MWLNHQNLQYRVTHIFLVILHCKITKITTVSYNESLNGGLCISCIACVYHSFHVILNLN